MNITDKYFDNFIKTPMTKYIHKMFINSFRKEWYEIHYMNKMIKK
jgi:hypothetical protein